jgi:hypothetical protein
MIMRCGANDVLDALRQQEHSYYQIGPRVHYQILTHGPAEPSSSDAGLRAASPPREG